MIKMEIFIAFRVLTLAMLFSYCTCHSIDPPVKITQIGLQQPKHQQQNQNNTTWSAHLPSTVLKCASPYIMRVRHLIDAVDHPDTSLRQLARITSEMIDILCRSNYHYGLNFIACVQMDLPKSTQFIDKVLNQTFNVSRLPHILYGGCNVSSELNSSMECIIRGVISNPMSVRCMADVGTYFHNILNVPTINQDTSAIEQLCRTWGRMISCIYPYVRLCDQTLGDTWLLFGREILTEQCEKHAQPFKNDNNRNDGIYVIERGFGVFASNNSAMYYCANRNNRDNAHFVPTLIMDPDSFTTTRILGISSLCGSEIDSYLYCMEERRLNSNTTTDNFLFSIINTVNLRMAYNTLCSNIEVLTAHSNCLMNTRLELDTCACYLTDLADRITEIHSSNPWGYSSDQMIGLYCSSYVSFVDCYVGLLSSCSPDLGQVMGDVYLGMLTPACLVAGTVPCNTTLLTQNTTLYSSAVFQCGGGVADYVSNATNNTGMSTRLDEMMTKMEDLIMDVYNYTCSLGDGILNCLQTNLLSSTHQTDQLLLNMFNVSKLENILTVGCDNSLILDVKSRLQYILSLILSDPRSSDCIEALVVFKFVQQGEINTSRSIDPYCRIWSDFGGCIEGKLSCSNRRLARIWRQFTMEPLNPDCYNTAIHQQNISTIVTECNRDSLVDSAVSLCGMSFMADHMTRKQEVTSSTQLDDVIKDDIDYFCNNNMEEAILMVDCLRSTLPASRMTIDRIVRRVFNRNLYNETAYRFCTALQDIKNRLRCIINSLEASNYLNTCLQHLKSGFDVDTFPDKTIDELKDNACSGWRRFSDCVLPHVHSCDTQLSELWSNLTYTVLSQQCQGQVVQTARLRSQNHSPALTFNSLLLAFSSFILFFI